MLKRPTSACEHMFFLQKKGIFKLKPHSLSSFSHETGQINWPSISPTRWRRFCAPGAKPWHDHCPEGEDSCQASVLLPPCSFGFFAWKHAKSMGKAMKMRLLKIDLIWKESFSIVVSENYMNLYETLLPWAIRQLILPRVDERHPEISRQRFVRPSAIAIVFPPGRSPTDVELHHKRHLIPNQSPCIVVKSE